MYILCVVRPNIVIAILVVIMLAITTVINFGIRVEYSLSSFVFYIMWLFPGSGFTATLCRV